MEDALKNDDRLEYIRLSPILESLSPNAQTVAETELDSTDNPSAEEISQEAIAKTAKAGRVTRKSFSDKSGANGEEEFNKEFSKKKMVAFKTMMT